MNHYDYSTGIKEIYRLLNQIGITANYVGYFQIAYAIYLCVQHPRRLACVTKWIYPKVAKRYETTVYAIERNLRTVIGMMWMRNRENFERITKVSITNKPGNAQFLAIITTYLITNNCNMA